jgi:hypothetical protein
MKKTVTGSQSSASPSSQPGPTPVNSPPTEKEKKTASQVAPKFTPRGAKRERILLAVTDGKIDFAGMSPESSKQLNELLHSPDVQAQFGIGPLSQKFDPQHCVRLYQALGKLFYTGTRVAMGWPDVAAQKLEYTEAECKELSVPTAAVLDQYGNRFLQENQSVIALALVFTAITQNKFQQAVEILKIERMRRGGNPEAPSPTPRPVVPGPQPVERRPVG